MKSGVFMRTGKDSRKARIYVCHTYYHVYVTFLKEFKLREEKAKRSEEAEGATLVLSKMSNDFEQLKERAERTGFFEEVVEFDEKKREFFPELDKYRKDTGSFVKNMINRIRFTKRFAKLQEAYIPVDFKQYKEIYVFCDSDPVGFYLNQNKIRYHALEDGLNCLKNYDAARYDNRGHFGLKAFFSSRLNLIFIQNGYGKYCIDMEVNDSSLIACPCAKYIDEPREELAKRLTDGEKMLLLKVFVRDMDKLLAQIEDCGRETDKILILTDPLCTLDVRERIFKDIVAMYEPEGKIFIKKHPRDELDYEKLFPGIPKFDATMPMEMLNFVPNLHFKRVVGVLTELTAIGFADETVRLGEDFMDKYEDPAIHRQNEHLS